MQVDPAIDREILLKSAIDDFPQICSSNRYFHQLCLTKSFWEEYYQRHGCLLLREYHTVSEYILNFRTAQKIVGLVDRLVDLLTNQVFKGDKTMIPSLLTWVRDIDYFDLPGIDYPELLKAATDVYYRKANDFISLSNDIIDRVRYDQTFLAVGGFSVRFIYHLVEKVYRVEFVFQDLEEKNYLDYDLSRDQFRTMLYVLLSRGVELKLSRYYLSVN